MHIQSSSLHDLPHMLAIYKTARHFMHASGNPHQWEDSYPSPAQLMQDIKEGVSYVVRDEDNEIVGTFCFICGKDDPTYLNIYEGNWLNEQPYGVIHRIASSGKVNGITNFCINWCFSQTDNLRIDTHRDNGVMQHILARNGFTYCGIIYLLNGDERLAYQKMK